MGTAQQALQMFLKTQNLNTLGPAGYQQQVTNLSQAADKEGKEEQAQAQAAAEAAEQQKQYQAAQKAEKDRQDQITKQKSLMGTQQEAGIRDDLATKLASARSGANRRGLLYSGLNQSAQMGLRGSAESQIASGRQKINEASQDQTQEMQQQQATRGLTQQQQDISKNSSAYRMAWDKKKGDQQTAAGVGSSVGGLLGAFL